MDIDWAAQLCDQVDWHWENQLRPRFAGLTDDEYFWEPVPGSWSVRPRGQAVTSSPAGGGAWVLDWVFPPPDPAPVTTIAWRLSHILSGVLEIRYRNHFSPEPVDFMDFIGAYEYPGSADEALSRLDDVYARWRDGVRGLTATGLARPCGPSEGPYAEHPLAALILHINREVIHHGAEVALLRDLYAAR
jgi:hypothetical protein